MFTNSLLPQGLIDATRAIMEAPETKLLLEPSKKMPEREQAKIVKDRDDKAAGKGHSADVREGYGRGFRGVDGARDREDDEGYARTKTADDAWNKKNAATKPYRSFSDTAKDVITKKPKVDEATSHQAKTTLKGIKNPEVQQRMAAHDIKPGIKGFRDRVDLLRDAQARGNLKEDEQLEEGDTRTIVNKDGKKEDVVKKPQMVRISGETNMDTKTVDDLNGRRRVPSTFHNKEKSYKVNLNVEEFEDLEEGKGHAKGGKNATALNFKADAKAAGKSPLELSRERSYNSIQGALDKAIAAEKAKAASKIGMKKEAFKGPTSDSGGAFVTDGVSPLKLAKDLARKSYDKIKTEALGKLGTSE